MARQERAIETRRKLLVGAAQVFDERGYAGASINEIQERSGVTKGAMYFHFASKEEIARGVMAAQTEVPTELRSQPASPMQQVIDLTHELARRLRTDVLFRASIRLTVERGTFQADDSALYDWWLRIFARELARAQGAGELRAEMTPEDVAASVVGSFTGIQMLSHVTCDRRDLHERLARWWEQILPGITTSKAAHKMLPTGSPELRLHDGSD
ncbi:ScbR family autoregulator-binding transcription factor [Streptomyces longwoodensis]|uniref:ScbR family autoregulator-binding transcription factor n=1 Tax=Streptomyces longwoodensis TaxID=68231 RepID=UPI002254F672|nr:ScbR family autoregulator-binding transcription factor [Streptomyces longwoodensis]MCX5000572.1 ScbR family autoregulator-binding transcription factor [Streptomyces longwoodensis]WTI49263.1 TetR/AcrR family transcriptional regulator [Streptomyces longwoodensis]